MSSTAPITTSTRATATPDLAIKLEVVLELSVGSRLGQLRAVPVRLGRDAAPAILAIYGADFEIDPYTEMFFFPTETLKMVLFTAAGEVLWRRDLGHAVVPGIWFCPVFPFDLDGDGVDEIWFVNNVNRQHPLGVSGYRLERLDARNGQTTGQWPWPNTGNDQSLSHQFRNFIAGGHVRGEPVLVSAQGTYGTMLLQAWRPDMTPRWEVRIPREAPGARGSHMSPIADLDQDGVQELLWGERCIDLERGAELFCADRDAYRGHSDIVQPVRDRVGGRCLLYTCRESDPGVSPRVVMFDGQGRRRWGHVDAGHMDIGWVARLGDGGQPGECVAMAIRIGRKFCGPDGRYHQATEQFGWDARTGEPHPLPFDAYRTIPVDLNGDGYHELVRGQPSGDGEVLDRRGDRIGSVGGPVAMASKFLDHPGEQLLSYHEDGTVRLWVDRNARDTDHAWARYADPLYQANQRLTAVGYNLVNLGGL